MNNTQGILKTIWIGLNVAKYLLKTGRGLQATELYDEILILLHNLDVTNHLNITEVIFNAYYPISGYANAARYTNKILEMFHEAGILTIRLAAKYLKEGKLALVKRILESAVNISKTNGPSKE